jgi:hypothetical protein
VYQGPVPHCNCLTIFSHDTSVRSAGYTQDVAHHYASSSAPAACSVESGSANYVGLIVSINFSLPSGAMNLVLHIQLQIVESAKTLFGVHVLQPLHSIYGLVRCWLATKGQEERICN